MYVVKKYDLTKNYFIPGSIVYVAKQYSHTYPIEIFLLRIWIILTFLHDHVIFFNLIVEHVKIEIHKKIETNRKVISNVVALLQC